MTDKPDSDKPETFTNAWWRKQWEEVQKGYRGATHAINRCNADYQSCWEAVKAIRDRMDSQESALEEARAEIGRLSGEVETLTERLVKAGRVVKEMKEKL